MSSQPDSPLTRRKRVPFEKWRKTMLVGAFVLLGNALAGTFIETGLPPWLSIFSVFLGYGLLVVGFGLRMRALKEQRARAAEARDREPLFDRGSE